MHGVYYLNLGPEKVIIPFYLSLKAGGGTSALCLTIIDTVVILQGDVA